MLLRDADSVLVCRYVHFNGNESDPKCFSNGYAYSAENGCYPTDRWLPDGDLHLGTSWEKVAKLLGMPGFANPFCDIVFNSPSDQEK
jgi:hypothetical protein